jgi:hypothetical protein
MAGQATRQRGRGNLTEEWRTPCVPNPNQRVGCRSQIAANFKPRISPCNSERLPSLRQTSSRKSLRRCRINRAICFHALRNTLCTNLAKAGVPRRTAMAIMRHSDGKLTDKTYTDENLLGTETAIDVLPSFTESSSQGASQGFGATGQNVALPVTTSAGPEVAQTVVNQGLCHGLALPVTTGQNAGNGGSGGARTRNLCRDRAAL